MSAWLLTAMAVLALSEDDLSTVRMEGTAPGVGPVAVAAALQDAELSIVVDVISSMTDAEDLRAFRPILDRAGAYIRTARVVRRDESDKGTRVEVEANVATRALRRDAAGIVLSMLPEPPRVLLVVVLQAPDGTAHVLRESRAVEGLHKALETAKFELVPLDVVTRLFSDEALQAALAGDDQALGYLGRQNLADVVIGVQIAASTLVEENSCNVTRLEATLTGRAVRAADAMAAEATTTDAAVYAIQVDEALEQAAEDVCSKAAPDLVLGAILAAAEGGAGDDGVILEVENLGDPQRLAQVTQAASAVWGVEKIEELVSTPQLGRLHVQYDGPVALFVDEVLAAPYAGFTLTTRSAIERQVVLAVE